MDCLSVAASVTGLPQVGANVISFLFSMADAPSTARTVLHKVHTLHAIFRQLDDFIVHFTKHSMARKSRIHVEDLVGTLTGCVCACFELDKVLECLNTDDGDESRFTAWDSVKWAAKDQEIASILRNLQMHKTSLSLMLTV
ncbi:hypothetical protein K440DRAFT_478712, partial [Wilcoxina mikolae CBS 423.85]